jgi:uncharacterized integral membrane protein
VTREHYVGVFLGAAVAGALMAALANRILRPAQEG